MYKKITLLGHLLLLAAALFSQPDVNWYFGDKAGITFDNETPTLLSGSSMRAFEAGASISDLSGKLLFYSNGLQVWDRFHQLMQNGNGLNGGPPGVDVGTSTTQGVLILPIPENQYKYVVFTLDQFNMKLYYSRVDMRGNGGLGEVELNAKNRLLETDSVCELMQAVKHGNGRDWWILLRSARLNDNSIIKLLLTPDTLEIHSRQQIGPVNFDANFPAFSMVAFRIGESDFSMDGEKYAFVNIAGMINVFDFDRCTGTLSNLQELGTPPYKEQHPSGFYGMAFSPNGQLLYVTSLTKRKLYQYDLSSSNPRSTKKTIYELGTLPSNYQPGQLQLAPDGKIYWPIYYSANTTDTTRTIYNTNLCVIAKPDQPGLNCDFRPFGLSIAPGRSFYNLPNLPNYNLGEAKPIISAGNDTALCLGESMLLGVTENERYSYAWRSLEAIEMSDAPQPKISPQNSGWYYLQVVDTATNMSPACATAYDSVFVKVEQPFNYPDLMEEIFCPGEIFTIGVPSIEGDHYLWNPDRYIQNTDSSYTIVKPLDEITYTLQVTRGAMESSCRTIEKNVELFTGDCMLPNVITPDGQGSNDYLRFSGFRNPLQLTIYDRWGNVVYESMDYRQDWNGKSLPEGVYFYTLQTPSRFFQNTLTLLR